ncbi:hypothetical protein [Burkholderia perseverans]|uniref:hypothetical protein n=1 Tax=Burkholderia perseverans TaxID=2615214 RepID=UPI001FF04053|nr:hypothetical protein [Burkholderia perseverans]
MNSNQRRFLARPGRAWLLALACLLPVAVAPAHAADAAAPSAQLTSVASLSAAARPANVPLDYVVTPNGYFAPECVQTIHADERLRADGSILKHDGSVRAAARCGRSHFDRQGHGIAPNAPSQQPAAAAAAGTVDPTYTGWIESANYNNGSNVGRLRASWKVPSTPSDAENQTVFFFPGLEQLPTVQSILQPVLGWNGFGDHAWTIASWNCCTAGTTTHTDPASVSPGDEIVGDTYSLCGTGVYDCGSWSIVTQDTTNGRSVTLNTAPQGQLQWVFGGVLEVYGISSCNQLPPQAMTQFYGVTVWDTNGNVLSPPWQAGKASSSISPQCNYSVAVSPGNVYLYY